MLLASTAGMLLGAVASILLLNAVGELSTVCYLFQESHFSQPWA
jgi:hypothetical protein